MLCSLNERKRERDDKPPLAIPLGGFYTCGQGGGHTGFSIATTVSSCPGVRLHGILGSFSEGLTSSGTAPLVAPRRRSSLASVRQIAWLFLREVSRSISCQNRCSTTYCLLRSLIKYSCINPKSLAFGYLNEKLIDTGLMKFLGLCPSALSWYLEFISTFTMSLPLSTTCFNTTVSS
ncbi:hypothetical protein GW17_00058562 [Ensete ventricosum]|nr:hypothetical protein GW17_00058562 [Ensete ventricosum]